MNDYSTEEELKKIKEWDPLKDGIVNLIEYIRGRWEYANIGYFSLTGKRVLRLELHTGGWSGNEDIIHALRSNIFWMTFWQRSLRGGHYYFKINLRNFNQSK